MAADLDFCPIWSAAVLCSAAFVFCVFGFVFSHGTAKTRKTRKTKAAEQSTAALQKKGRIRAKNATHQSNGSP
jgi:hypothetical protein